MPASTLPGNLGFPRLLSTAGGGTALTTTRAFIAVPQGISNLIIIPRNFSTAVVAKVSLNPWITVISTNDAMRSNPTVQSNAAQDGATGTLVTLSSLPTLANGGAVYIGASNPFSALQATVVAANSGGGTMAVTYWNGSTFTNITPTDNTTNMSTSGSITWTVPTDWVKADLGSILALGQPRIGVTSTGYWIRIATSAAYDSSVTLSSLYALGQYGDSGGMEIPEGFVYQTSVSANTTGNISALTDAGTANLIVDGFTY